MSFEYRLKPFGSAQGGEPGAFLATRVAALDGLGGGLPRGSLIELSGPPSSGTRALALAALAAATFAGELAALVDLGAQLDPQLAQEAGVDLSRLLWLKADETKRSLMAAELALEAGLGLVVLDLGGGLRPLSMVPESAWLKLARSAQGRRSILLVVAPRRLSQVAAAAVIEAQAGVPLWAPGSGRPPLLDGLGSRLQARRRKGPREEASAELRLPLFPSC